MPRRRFLRALAGDRRAGARRLRPAVEHRVVPEGAGRRRSADARRATSGHAAQGDGAGVHRGGSVAAVSQQRHGGAATTPSTRRWRSSGFADYRLEVDGLVEQPGAASRSPSCARCRAARRSRATIASRAGARSASGRARSSRRCSRPCSRSPRRATSCSTAPTRWRTTARSLVLREHRLRGCLPSADDPRLRAERQGAAGAERRADHGCASSGSSATSTRST